MLFRSSVLALTIVSEVLSANILFVTVIPSPSHHIWSETLVEGLLENGHNITMIGYEEPGIKSSNYTLLKLYAEQVFDDAEMRDWALEEKNVITVFLVMWGTTVLSAEETFRADALKRLLDYPRDFFDLVVFDMTLSQHLYPLIDYFGDVPSIGMSPFGMAPYIGDAFGQHFHSYFPNFFLPYTDEMSFLERTENTMIFALSYLFKSYYMKILKGITAKQFGDGVDSLEGYERRISLLLTNYDPVLDYPQPLPPQIIPVGGLNAKPAKKLPEAIQKIMDGAEHGVIYFSLGSNIDPSWLSAETREMLLDALSKLKETILWKYTGEDLKDIPKNVVIRKWFPQNDILAHPNVKLFISHAGLLSTHESIYHGVPIVSIPFCMDQINNARKIEAKSIGKRLDIRRLTGDDFYRAIRDVLDNPM